MKLLAILLLLCLSIRGSECAQLSVFSFANSSSFVDAPIFGADGLPLEGPGYLVELWGGLNPESLVPALNAFPTPGDRLIAPFDSGGYFVAGCAAVPSMQSGGYSWLQVRAWDARLGSTYEEVVPLNVGGYGESSVFYADGKDPGDMLGICPPLVGLESFSLRPVVPEPSTWTLLATGGLGLFWITRSRRRGSARTVQQ